MRKYLMLLLLAFGLALSGCDRLMNFLQTPTPTPGVQTTDSPAQPVQSTPTPRSPDELIIWIDPIFASDTETPGGQLLQERIAAFEELHPGITVNMRIKTRSGPSGLLETLSNIGTAAPNLNPDLITLNPELLHMAYIRGLIYSMDGIYEAPSGPDWYSFAVDSAWIENSFLSLPFGAEAQAFVYRRDRYTTIPNGWSEILNGAAPLLFPSADPEAVFTIAMYQAAGGQLRAEENALQIDRTTLTDILSLYSSARSAGLLPTSVLEMVSSTETWTAFHEGRAGIALAPYTAFSHEYNPETEAMIPIPVNSTTSLTIAETWGWAVATEDSTRQPLVMELLGWLSAPEFVGPWTEAVGLLPVSRPVLENWADTSDISLANLLIPSIRAIPELEFLETVGPILQPAVQSVVEGSKPADLAAQDAALEINTH
ncbi:MAG: extracellular solute-binding protein [Anaerolineales bacterium]|nr:extracellular solute-binding protein [Anaerolineales bacterium]